MQIIKAVVFEPVGCLAEFPAEEFDEIAARLFGVESSASQSGSEAYWRLLNLIEESGGMLRAPHAEIAQGLELQAIDRIHLYEDAAPAFSALKAMGIQMLLASSLSGAAVTRVMEKFSIRDYFAAVWSRDTAGGVKNTPLARAIESASFQPEQVIFLVDTEQSLEVAKQLGANSMLMINDYDQGKDWQRRVRRGESFRCRNYLMPYYSLRKARNPRARELGWVQTS